jgi:hypothetical protein
MLRQRFGRLAAGLITAIAGVFWLTAVVPVEAQVGRGSDPQLAKLQSEVKAQRTSAAGLRAEVKRQQRLVGELRKRVETLESGVSARELRLDRLRDTVETQRNWLIGLGVLVGLITLVAAMSRPADGRSGSALAAARERNVRLRDEMSALDARIRAAERQGVTGRE